MGKKLICPLCLGSNVKIQYKRKDGKIYQCINDGLFFLNPQPRDKELFNIYNERYFEKEKNEKIITGYYRYIDEKNLFLDYFRKKIYLLKKYVKKGRLLDVGCSHGFLLEEAKKSGFDPIGIDISEYMVEYTKEHGYKAIHADIKSAGFKDNYFDVVTAFQVIEHLKNPKDFFKEVHRILKPGGIFMVATPNADGYLKKILGKYLPTFKHREHILFFSARPMLMALHDSKFVSVKILKDEVRFYPFSHFLGGLKYYLRNSNLNSLIENSSSVFEKLNILNIKLPVPLDTLLIICSKPYR